MGLLAGALSFRRFKVKGELPGGFRDQFLENIARFALRENDRARTKDDNCGWVSITDPADTDLHLNKFLFSHYLVLTFRVDRKRVPARYLAIQLDKKVREVMALEKLQRVGPNRKKELKAALEEELLGRALPVVATFDMAWDLETMELWLFTTSDVISDLFRGLFKDTFGLELERIRPSHWLSPLFPRDELAALVEGLEPEKGWKG